MTCYSFEQEKFDNYANYWPGQAVLPDSHIILQQTPFHNVNAQGRCWKTFFSACRDLAQQISTPTYVFLDASWDPVYLSNTEIAAYLASVQEIFNKSKVCLLSARAQHFYDNIPGCVYFPLFLMLDYPNLQWQPKKGRIGCLNRRNAPHRIFLMHHLLDRQLIDPQRDVYSVSFTNVYSGNYTDVDSAANSKGINQAQLQWPSQIQTHPDNFPNDYGITHPAWHTGVVIITETEVDQNTLICEKTAKGILSRSCFSVYMHEVGYRVLEDLGFEPRFFPDHAQDFNIKPIVKICKMLPTADDAIAYSQQHQSQIDHNFSWFAPGQGAMQSRPWFNRWHTKLQQVLDNL